MTFDGVIHSYSSGWTGPIPSDPPVEGALEFVNWLVDNGAEVVIITARVREHEDEAHQGIREWLKKYGFPDLEVTNIKKSCAIYIDDRGYRFDGDFKPLYSFLEKSLDPGTWLHAGDQWKLDPSKAEYHPKT